MRWLSREICAPNAATDWHASRRGEACGLLTLRRMTFTTALEPSHRTLDLKPERKARARSIVIVGGGFAGATLAYHLLTRRQPPLVTLIERGQHVGRGIAYATEQPALRLNVPASRMSLDPARPNDFVEFAGAQAEPDAFLSRAVYGRYVESRLANARRMHPTRLRVVRAAAVAIEGDSSVRLEDGRRLQADRVVLATGLAARASHCRWPHDPRVIDAWDERAVSALSRPRPRPHPLPRHDRVLVLGSGLSALDVIGLLDSAGHQGDVVVLSRHGLLPRPHAERGGRFALPAALGPAPKELLRLCAWMRAVVRAAEAAGHPWQHAIDALRPQLSELWCGLSARDRLRFVRRVRPYWEVLRHRAPTDALARLEARRRAGSLTVVAGELLHCSAEPEALAVELRLRATGAHSAPERVVQRFSHVMRCTGPALELDLPRSPLLAALIHDGRARHDCARLDIATGPHGQLIEASGLPSERLFALGQLCRASRWETTSVPEIVCDAVALAELLSAA